MRNATQFLIRGLLLILAGVALGKGVEAQGVTQTVAGGGITGFCGDGLRASLACINNPYGISFDSEGFRYIADHDGGNYCASQTRSAYFPS